MRDSNPSLENVCKELFPVKEFELSEVYGLSRDIPVNYVERENVDNKLRDNLNRKKHLTIFGSSKQGKTCLRKHCIKDTDYILVQCSNKWSISDLNANILKRAGFEISESTKISSSGKAKILAKIQSVIASIGSELEASTGEETTYRPLELDVDDANDIISALHEIGFRKYIVLEDFHYLKSETQKDFAIELKAFHENSDLCFIIVGVWLDENKLVIYNGDLTGRIIPINADLWTNEDLKKVIRSGAKLLNIEFDDLFVEDLLKVCSGNVYFVQEACYRACYRKGIKYTQNHKICVGDDLDANTIVKEIIQEQSGRYNSFLTQYASGFQETTLEMHKWLLYPILTSSIADLSHGIKYRYIRNSIEAVHPSGGNLNPGNVTQALKAVSSLQITKSIQPIILDYDESNLILHIVDKGFLIWIETQNRNELLELAGLPRFSGEITEQMVLQDL